MNKNIGTVDKVIRVFIGVLLIALVFIGPQTAWGWLGVPVILIALFGWCPLYKMIGFSTCKPCKQS